jgi:prepilin-type N-terminal cleavage/methylation domain-containing protein
MLELCRRGFTLLEISIVLLIMAAVMGGGAVIFAASLHQRQSDDTKAKLAVLQVALLDYRRAFNRLPCPADATRDSNASSNNYFGIESATIDNNPVSPTYHEVIGCNFGSGTPQANFNSGSTDEGMVPTKTLGLPDDYAFDDWGRRIMYAVDQRLTLTDAFTTIPVTDSTPRITVNNTMAGSTPTQITNLAVYVLVSFGPNGHGAYPRGFGAQRVNAGSTNVDEAKNCHCNSDGTSGAFSGVFVQKVETQNPNNLQDSFDDIVVFAKRSSLRTLVE